MNSQYRKLSEVTSLFCVAAHKASSHMSGMTKAASKQARTLELEFTLAPRARERPDRGHRDHREYRGGGGDQLNVDRAPYSHLE